MTITAQRRLAFWLLVAFTFACYAAVWHTVRGAIDAALAVLAGMP